MALVKEAILQLRAEGFREAATAAGSIEKGMQNADRGIQGAQKSAISLGSALSRAAAAANLASSIFGASDSPLLHGVGQVLQGASIGAGLGGPAGAAIGAGVFGAMEVAKAFGGGKTEIHNHVQVSEGAVRDAARQAGEDVRAEVERRLADLRSDMAYSRATSTDYLQR